VDEHRFPILIRDLYRIVGELEQMFERPFTPDGHMVGSIGECLVRYYYGVELTACSTEGCDAIWRGRSVEIKATQGDCVALRCEPQHLIAIRLDAHGGFEEIYNGPGTPVWSLVRHRPVPRNGQYQVRLSTLRRLMKTVPDEQRIPKIR
jgi:hypothetical protein